MEEVTPQERAALRAFYVDGLSIAEIAARHQRPSGTIRRRLSPGRDQVRALLGVTRNERNRIMQQEQTEADKLIEAYVTKEGRTLMHRRYNGNRWSKRNAP